MEKNGKKWKNENDQRLNPIALRPPLSSKLDSNMDTRKNMKAKKKMKYVGNMNTGE